MKSAGEDLMKRRVIRMIGSELYEKKLAIIGLAATGMEVAKRSKCFGMCITAITKHPDLKKEGKIDDDAGNNNDNNFNFINKIQGVEGLLDSLTNANLCFNTYTANR
jgi:lactate dehydrogenase-like 2-hydroxyacid dehydrogenase